MLDAKIVFVRDRNNKKKWIAIISTDLSLSEEDIIARTSVVMVRYMMLAVENSNNDDPRTIGELIFYSFDKLQDVKFSEALKLILEILQETLQELLFLTEEQIKLFIDAFIAKLPKYISKKMIYKKSA